MTARRLSGRRRLWLDERLTDRDRLVLSWLATLRLATGRQLEALAFDGLRGHSRAVVRGRVLGRLATWGLVETVDHRVGGALRGSSSPVYRLTSGGQQLLQPSHPRSSKPYTDRFTAHTLAIAELAVELHVATLPGEVTLTDFVAEPASWQPDGVGNYLKPDAYLRLVTPAVADQWWAEVDLGTESLPAVERKLRAYLDFVARGQPGPRGLVPRVLVSTTGPARVTRVAELIRHLPSPADNLFVVAEANQAVAALLGVLRE